MYKLCHYIKADSKLCCSPAMRHQSFCYHHLQFLRRERRIATAKQRFLSAVLKDHPLNSLPAVQLTIAHLLDGIALDRVEKKQAKVMVSALQLMASNIRDFPELADYPGLRQIDNALTSSNPGSSVSLCSSRLYL